MGTKLPFKEIISEQELANAILKLYNYGRHHECFHSFKSFEVTKWQDVWEKIKHPYSAEEPTPWLVCLGSNLVTDAEDIHQGEDHKKWPEFENGDVIDAINSYCHERVWFTGKPKK